MTGIFDIEILNVRGQFCLLAFKLYCQDKKIGLQDIATKLFVNDSVDFFELIDLMYFSCKAYAQLNAKEFEYSKAKFTNDFENVDSEVLGQCTEKFLEVKLFGKSLLDNGVNSNKENKSKKK